MLEHEGHWVRASRAALLAFSAVAVLAGSGCQTVAYYRQAIQGELQILRERRPIAELIAQPGMSPKLKQQLELVLRLRGFAQQELKLPTNRHYLSYVDLHRRFAVWNVHAAPEFSLKPKTWWYPLVGSLKYRGYFLEPEAREYGAQLARQDMDVFVEGVEAYSTLGWFADPILNTFIGSPEPDLAEIIFHELTHQRLFLSGDTDFNEAFATTVAEEGVRRWFQRTGDAALCHRYEIGLERNRQFVELVMRTRAQLQGLYGRTSNRPPPRKSEQSAAWKEEKARMIAELRAEYEKLKVSWAGYAGYDGWFKRPLNNAQLNTIAVYYELVPGFQALLGQTGGDLERFYKTVEGMRKLSKNERRQRLQRLGQDRVVPAFRP